MQTLLKAVAETPQFRRFADAFDPDATAVLLLAKDLADAVEHYGELCPRLPEFRILDWENAEPVLAACARQPKVAAFPAARLREFPHKTCRLFVRRTTAYMTAAIEYADAYFKAHALGLTTLQIDAPHIDAFLTPRTPILSPEAFHEEFERYNQVYFSLADAESRRIFAAVLKYRLTGDFGCIPVSHYRQYDHPLVQARAGDVACDAGVYNGNTTYKFSRTVGAAGKVFAFEPMPKAYQDSLRRINGKENVVLEELGLWSREDTLYIRPAEDGVSNCRTTPDAACIPCRVVALDAYLAGKNQRCDFLKMDIEGAEYPALLGALETLRACRPKLAISIYHCPWEDFLRIPEFILGQNLGYTFHLGHHSPYAWETILYCLPQ